MREVSLSPSLGHSIALERHFIHLSFVFIPSSNRIILINHRYSFGSSFLPICHSIHFLVFISNMNIYALSHPIPQPREEHARAEAGPYRREEKGGCYYEAAEGKRFKDYGSCEE